MTNYPDDEIEQCYFKRSIWHGNVNPDISGQETNNNNDKKRGNNENNEVTNRCQLLMNQRSYKIQTHIQ